VSQEIETRARLVALFDAERTVRRSHEELLAAERGALVSTVRHAVDEAIALSREDSAEGNLRLVRLAALLGDYEGGGDVAVDTLIDILGCEEPEARHVAGQALEDLAFDRFKEVALGIERATERLAPTSHALTELPYLLAEVGEPGCVKLLGRFLKHANAEVVASAIEAIVEMGDPSASGLLAPLEKDTRQVQLDEDDPERVAIGDLATEARQLFAELAPPPRKGGR
jgi:HEAT repeat protein